MNFSKNFVIGNVALKNTFPTMYNYVYNFIEKRKKIEKNHEKFQYGGNFHVPELVFG